MGNTTWGAFAHPKKEIMRFPGQLSPVCVIALRVKTNVKDTRVMRTVACGGDAPLAQFEAALRSLASEGWTVNAAAPTDAEVVMAFTGQRHLLLLRIAGLVSRSRPGRPQMMNQSLTSQACQARRGLPMSLKCARKTQTLANLLQKLAHSLPMLRLPTLGTLPSLKYFYGRLSRHVRMPSPPVPTLKPLRSRPKWFVRTLRGFVRTPKQLRACAEAAARTAAEARASAAEQELAMLIALLKVRATN